MKKTKKSIIPRIYFLRYFFCILFIFSTIYAKSQIYSKTIQKQFSLKNAPCLAERIIMHTDRKDYISGEDIWFSAYYSLNNQTYKEPFSKILYLELVDADGLPVIKQKFVINNSGSNGCIRIPESLLSGNYTLFAYTKWMKNIGLNSFSKTKIFIINPDKAVFTYQPDSLNKEKLFMNFYPNGGQLVAEFNNTINYKVRNYKDEAVEAKIKIVDKDFNTVKEFKSSSASLNQFDFIPFMNGNYRALVKGKDSTVQVFSLPRVHNTGILTSVENKSKEYIRIQFESNEKTPAINKNLIIEIESNGYIYKTVETSISSNISSEVILKKDLLNGWNRIVVRNLSGEKLFETNIEIPSPGKQEIEIMTDKKVYARREKVKLSLKQSNNIKSGRNSKFSVSVSKFSDKIIGDVENKQNSAEAEDNLSRIVFVEDSNYLNKKIEFLPETKGLIISGNLISKSANSPLGKINVFLSTLNNDILLQNSITNSEGKFYFNLEGLNGKSELVLQVADQLVSDVQINVDKDYYSPYLPAQNKAISAYNFDYDYYKNLMINYQIQKQYNPTANGFISEKEAGSIFYGESDSTYYLQKYIDLPNLEDFFNEIIGNVKVKTRKENQEIIINYLNTSNQLSLSPLLLVDGVPVFNVNRFLKILPSEIEKIDIINSNYILGDMKYGGVINLIPKKKNLANIAAASALSFFQFDGISSEIRFNEIKYSEKSEIESRLPDFRNTLYWNPEIQIDENGNAELTFYTSDESGKYLITAAGLNSNGEGFLKQSILEVK